MYVQLLHVYNINPCKIPPRISSVVDKAPRLCDILMRLAHQIHLDKKMLSEDGIGQVIVSEQCQLNQSS